MGRTLLVSSILFDQLICTEVAADTVFRWSEDAISFQEQLEALCHNAGAPHSHRIGTVMNKTQENV
jgi:hypothetical protein